MTIAAVLGIDVTAQSTTPEFIPGQLGVVTGSTGTKIYKYLKYDDGTAAVDGVAGEVAYYYTLDGYKNHVCSSDLSDSIEIGAGVIQANIATETYGWFQIKGAATLSIALTAGADGDPLTPTGSADGTLDVSSAATDNVCAIAGDISDKEIICDFPM
ncbi:hypothetical protein N9S98_00355 [Alphaproteobacteria bacterium]|jgi:hypothetical protein|nr:hypothetical protein [Alphaproteobacteria bacterium]